MKKAIIITVRMKSNRLPKKAILEIEGRTIVEHLIDRMKLVKDADMIIIATSINSQDDILEEIAKRNGIECFRGSEADKLQRYLDASKKFNFDYMVDVSADNIFSSDKCVEIIFNEFEKNQKLDIIFFKNLPVGVSPVGMNMSAIEKICNFKDEEDTEAYGFYLFNSKFFNVKYLNLEEKYNRPDIRLTIDYQEDYDLTKTIFEKLNVKTNIFSLEKIIDLFNQNPKLLDINREAQKRYEENFKNLTKAKIKEQYKDLYEV